ncbi:methyltransferase domain-containing protein [Acetobacterium paludosum]|uniref:Methyltransferase domain-containing protein n=2 Tax=Acetobacterium paludosum TaxID=52693 RepID=A0A923HQL5_9FIRM|nr:methyltransferase domain-containing protein [Acetobacterium paludosum]MBC3886994.1 methyltransferase domain-containing protein [Acetobacterium paludosum]
MTHKFDVKNKHKLDNQARRAMLPPEKTLARLGLKSGDIMADIGCGIGYFSIPAAKIVGKSGQVYALDISEEMLGEVDKKIMDNHIGNIKTIAAEENKLNLENSNITFAFISTVLHELDDKDRMLDETKELLADKGRIAIVEWQKISSEFGPPIGHRLDKTDLMQLLAIHGFQKISAVDISDHFYGITAYKN